MTNKTTLYVVRHGQTFFNKSGRVQGWSDTPLTPEGAQNISYLGRGLKDIPFEIAYSSDAGRARETAQLILAEHLDQGIEHVTDPRIREWSFGSHEGKLEDDWLSELAKIADFPSTEDLMKQPPSYQAMAKGIKAIDDEGWTESYDQIVTRTLTGFTEMVEKVAAQGGGNLLAVSHGLTIAHFLSLVSPQAITPGLQNGSVSKLAYQDGLFTVLETNSLAYMKDGTPKH